MQINLHYTAVMLSISCHWWSYYDSMNTSVQINTVHLYFCGLKKAGKSCSSLILFHSLCLSLFRSLTHRHRHTHTHTHTLYSTMTVIKHAFSQPFLILYIHCWAAMTLSCTPHFKYALLWRQIEFNVCLWLESCSREYGAWAGTVCEQLQYELTNNLELLWVTRTSKEWRDVCSRSLLFWDQQELPFLCESRLCVSFWSECRFSYNLQHLSGWE